MRPTLLRLLLVLLLGLGQCCLPVLQHALQPLLLLLLLGNALLFLTASTRTVAGARQGCHGGREGRCTQGQSVRTVALCPMGIGSTGLYHANSMLSAVLVLLGELQRVADTTAASWPQPVALLPPTSHSEGPGAVFTTNTTCPGTIR